MCTGVHKLEHLTVKLITKNKQHLFDVHTKQLIEILLIENASVMLVLINNFYSVLRATDNSCYCD